MNYHYFLLILPLFLIIGFLVQLIKTIKSMDRKKVSVELKKYSPSDIQIQHLSQAIKHKTISNEESDLEDDLPFADFKLYLEKTYSKLYKACTIHYPGDRSILIHLQGKDSSLKPVCLMSHFDVVDPNELQKWEYPPFSGEVAEGFIWGRGAQDIKIHLIALLEAATKLIESGETPLRDTWFAFGGDEEVGGKRGAATNVAFFKENEIDFEYVLDEGAVIVDGMVNFIKNPTAMIGISEKGRVTIELTVQGKPGHSAMPPTHTAAGIIGKAVAAIENKPFKSSLNYSISKMLKSLAASAPSPINFFLANNHFYSFLLKKILKKTASIDVLMHTTQAVTVLRSGVKENIIPEEAQALINLRIVPGETMESCLKHIKKAVNDNRVEISIWGGFPGNNPIEPSSLKSEGYTILQNTLNEVLPGVPTIPYMVTASTDSRSYKELTDTILRFTPVIFQLQDLKGIHGYNERISIDNFGLCIEYFYVLLKK